MIIETQQIKQAPVPRVTHQENCDIYILISTHSDITSVWYVINWSQMYIANSFEIAYPAVKRYSFL